MLTEGENAAANALYAKNHGTPSHAVMYSVRRSAPPNVQLAGVLGVRILPIITPEGDRIWMPSPALVQILPSVSQRKPSGMPGLISANTLPPLSLLAAPTLNCRIWCGRSGPKLAALSAT